MKKNVFFININEKILILFLILFSLIINQYYGNKGIFPADSFAHFDSGYRVLLGEDPFKDYWVVSGPLLDYIQSILFYFFGVNWQSYILHASLFNVILTISTFLVLRNFNLKIYYSFFYSILFAVLAYPSSGTPFFDHHSTFFSLLGIYSLILGIKNEKKIYWILLPILLGLVFFSKQVPTAYVIISTILILIFFSIVQKKYYWVKYSFTSSILFICFLLIFGKVQEINFSSFLEQYIFYPLTIADQRFDNYQLTFRGVISHFIFIYISLIPLLYFNLKSIIKNKNYLKDKNFLYFLILITFTFSLIFHQILTNNQTFIFFLIPILFAFSNLDMNKLKLKSNNIILSLLLLTCLFATFKYHMRFNEGRKFHELNYANFKLSSNAIKIDKKLEGLKWITPQQKNDPNKEINQIREIKLHLLNDLRNKMLISNYSFFSVILNEKLFSPSRWYLSDGTDYPLRGNKHFTSYKKLLIGILKKNNISVIYIISPQDSSILYNYIDKGCFVEREISKILKSYELKNCNEINS
ncbi:MAG: Dolichyl-phosphate-mannose-protein mannosyltransferase [Pelagibacterales bacterium]|nr:Dolichyl-phosphate-mannose-protein mannosyltransferase [Pelagibacterales bacterium]